MHPFAQFIANMLPVTLPSMAMKNVMMKGFTIEHQSVYIGFTVLAVWIVGSLTLSFIVQLKNKFVTKKKKKKTK